MFFGDIEILESIENYFVIIIYEFIDVLVCYLTVFG